MLAGSTALPCLRGASLLLLTCPCPCTEASRWQFVPVHRPELVTQHMEPSWIFASFFSGVVAGQNFHCQTPNPSISSRLLAAPTSSFSIQHVRGVPATSSYLGGGLVQYGCAKWLSGPLPLNLLLVAAVVFLLKKGKKLKFWAFPLWRIILRFFKQHLVILNF